MRLTIRMIQTNGTLLSGVLAISSLVAAASCSGSTGGVAMPPSVVGIKNATLGPSKSERVRIKVFDDLVPPRSYYSPEAIAVGPDGALWITDNVDQDYGESAVVRVLPSGNRSKTFFYHGLTSEGSGLTGITAGPDGALWVTDQFNRQILRLLTSGRYRGFPLSHFATPAGITEGPDGALWFTAGFDSTAEIGRITTSGQITTYDVGEGADGITTGPDGALWFCETSIDTIGRITTDGNGYKLLEWDHTRVRAALDRRWSRRRALVYRIGRRPHRPHHDGRRSDPVLSWNNADRGAVRHRGRTRRCDVVYRVREL